MTEQSHQKNKEDPVLATEMEPFETSLAPSHQDLGELPINVILEEIHQEWLDAEKVFKQSQDDFGLTLSLKVRLLCQALNKLVNPVLLHGSQRAAVRDLIPELANNLDAFQVQSSTFAAYAVLPIATWINSCKP